MSKLHLVDGSSYIFRAYYAVAPLSTSKGLPSNALLGFTRMLVKLLRDVEASHVAVVFDTGDPTFRHLMYDDYKANRAECPEDLVPQMPHFRRIVEALGISSLEQSGVEADDIIASIALSLRSRIESVVIVSADKDLTQLVGPNVVMWDAMRDFEYDEVAVKNKFGVGPHQMGDYLALVGDSSDNIPGVAGVGPKTASALLNHFGSLDEVLSRKDEIASIKGVRGAKSLADKLNSSLKTLELSRKLVHLKTDVKPFCELNSAECFFWEPPSVESYRGLFEELEFERLLDEVAKVSPRPSVASPSKLKTYQLVSADSLARFASELNRQTRFSFDTETTSIDLVDAELVGISIAWEAHQAFYLPIQGLANPGDLLQLQEILKLCGSAFCDPNKTKVGFNLKYDIAILESHGFKVSGPFFDGLIAAHLLEPNSSDRGLKALAKRHLGEQMQTFEQLIGSKTSIKEVPVSEIISYACHDADASLLLADVLEPRLHNSQNGSKELFTAFSEVEMPLIPVLARMETVGVKVDRPYLQDLGKQFSASLAEQERAIYNLVGDSFNLNSPKQLSEVLFANLKLPTKGIKKTTLGYSTDAKSLQRLKTAHPIVPLLLDYREVFKLQSTYVDALQKLARSDTDRVYSSFHQATTATGRLSSSEPNLQNIPIRNPRGRLLRRAFIADEGFSLLRADYSQIELRVLADLSGDRSLIEAFERGEDIHLATARDLFGQESLENPEQKSELRRVAKTINFGVIYGMGPFRLARELSLSRGQATEYIDNYFSRYPKVREYFDNLREQIDRLGYVETMFGRRRYLSDVNTSSRDAGYAERSLLNAPIQGSAAEIIKRAMVRTDEYLEQSRSVARLILQVHDELIFEVRKGAAEEISRELVRLMEDGVELSVPLVVDWSIGDSWEH